MLKSIWVTRFFGGAIKVTGCRQGNILLQGRQAWDRRIGSDDSVPRTGGGTHAMITAKWKVQWSPMVH
jgi:hypothetical protein